MPPPSDDGHGYPRPNWYLFNRISLMPAAGVALVVGGVVESRLWIGLLGILVALAGTWLTMRRLTGRISERSLVWVCIDTAVVLVGFSLVLAFHLSGVAFFVALGIPALASEAIATAFTGVKEAGWGKDDSPGMVPRTDAKSWWWNKTKHPLLWEFVVALFAVGLIASAIMDPHGYFHSPGGGISFRGVSALFVGVLVLFILARRVFNWLQQSGTSDMPRSDA